MWQMVRSHGGRKSLTLEVGNIKSRDLCVPLGVFGLGDGAAWRCCKYINVKWGNRERMAVESRSFVCSINYISGMCLW